MPPAAARKTPSWSATAPVNAPRRWPKSWLSSSVSDRPAQLIATNGAVATDSALVDRPRDELLAGAALARDQHACSSFWLTASIEPVDRLHRLRCCRSSSPMPLEADDLAAQARVLALERLELQDALDRRAGPAAAARP